MRLPLALLLAAAAVSAHAADAPPPDPLAVLITQLSAPVDEKAAAADSKSNQENSARLAAIQSSLTAAAAGFEALRAPSHAAAASGALTGEVDPALKPFVKSRDASLDAVYRTLAVVDYTWALRFPKPACAPAERRAALLKSVDGLFVDPDVGSLSPWMARLMGSAAFGLPPAEALDQAAAPTKLTAGAYEKLRVRAGQITEELSAGKAAGAERAALYCERADAYEQLARAHRAEAGPTLASRSSGDDDPAFAAGSVFLLAARGGNGYDVLGAGFLMQTGRGRRLVTDASIVRGRKDVVAFARPKIDGALGRPIPVVIERRARGVGPAIGRLDGESDAPALTPAAASPAADELVTGLGPLRMAGPWTATQGLVTRVGAATFSSDAALSAEMAGSPVLNDRGEAAGLMIRRGAEISALKVEKLRAFLDGETVETPEAEFIASRNSGSASLLTTVRPVDAYPWSASGAALNWGSGGSPLSMQKLFGGIFTLFHSSRAAE
jgi:hypothetical protein